MPWSKDSAAIRVTEEEGAGEAGGADGDPCFPCCSVVLSDGEDMGWRALKQGTLAILNFSANNRTF